MSELLKLAERVEAATGPDRELDFDILRETSPTFEDDWYGWEDYRDKPSWPKIRDANTSMLPAYTDSLDAAMTLVPEGRVWSLRDAGADAGPYVYIHNEHGGHDFAAFAATPALALVATCLKARDRDGGSAGDAKGGSTAKQRQPGPKASPKSHRE